MENSWDGSGWRNELGTGWFNDLNGFKFLFTRLGRKVINQRLTSNVAHVRVAPIVEVVKKRVAVVWCSKTPWH